MLIKRVLIGSGVQYFETMHATVLCAIKKSFSINTEVTRFWHDNHISPAQDYCALYDMYATWQNTSSIVKISKMRIEKSGKVFEKLGAKLL